MIKLIALDIDDTLLTSQRHILPTTKQAVQDALAQGIKVLLCTGRPLAGAKPFLDELGIAGDEQYVITYNGAVTETVSGQVMAKHLLDNAAYREITAYGQAHHLPTNVLDAHSNIYTANRDVDWWIVEQAAENEAGLFIRQPDELPADFAIAKGAFVGPESLLDAHEAAVKAAFQDRFYVVRAGRNFIELMDPTVNKGQALSDLAAQLNLTAENVMAVGDEGNDLPMFDFAGVAVSMGNGTAEAKAHADYVTAANDDDGLAQAIRKFAL